MRTLKFLVVVVLLTGCAKNAATGRRQFILMSEAEEIQLGKQSDVEVRKQMGVYEDKGVQEYVQRVGRRLAQSSQRTKLPWTFTVVDEPAVNAFALPGGFIYLTRGIMPFLRDEAEMAAVLGHEIGHVDGRHSAEAYSNQTVAGAGLGVLGVLVPETRPFAEVASLSLGLLFLKHGRNAELEADQLGVRYSGANGWSPAGMSGLLTTLARLDTAGGTSRGVPNWALTHPPAADRVEKVKEAVAAATSPSATATNAAELERRLGGLVFGDSREDGFVRGNEFLHPVLRFAVRFPDGWEIVNSSEQVTAKQGEQTSAAMLLQLATNATGSPQQTANTMLTKAGFQETDGQRTRVNGLDAYIGTYEGVLNNRALRMQAAVIRSDQQTYIVAGIAPPAEFGGVSRNFSSSIQSFRALSRDDADRLQPDRVDFHVVRSGDTWESLARSAGGRVKPGTLAILNGTDPGTPPRVGDRVRIVVGG